MFSKQQINQWLEIESFYHIDNEEESMLLKLIKAHQLIRKEAIEPTDIILHQNKSKIFEDKFSMYIKKEVPKSMFPRMAELLSYQTILGMKIHYTGNIEENKVLIVSRLPETNQLTTLDTRSLIVFLI